MENFELDIFVVSQLRDPVALAIYTYVTSLGDGGSPPSTQGICDHFNIDQERFKTALDLLVDLDLIWESREPAPRPGWITLV